MDTSKPIHSRRSFLKSSALAGGGMMLSLSWLSSAKAADKLQELNLPKQWSELTAYIKITPDNVVKMLCPNPEFGQNVMTSLPMIIAEELDVDWKKVVVDMGPHDNVKLGPQFTGGSNSVRMYWKTLREAGAAAQYHRGVAAYFCHNSYTAHVVDMVTRDGGPYVERVFSAIDCGIVINPDAATNMVQGAVVDGIGNAFYGALTHKAGAAEQSNSNKYRLIRHNEAPKTIEVHFVENDLDPTGLGEPPFPPVFGAVANALYKTTGKRQYNQPFKSDPEKRM